MNGNILEIENLTKELGAFRLNGVSFSLPRGFIMGLIGPNGAGKTTTIKLILNMLRPDGGSIRLFGKDASECEPEIKQRLGVVMDQTFYADEWRLTDVERVQSRFYEDWSQAEYFRLLANFGLDRDKRVKELSRGMKMKLMIASALSHGAQLLILDEPTSGLDAVARSELADILSDFIADGTRSVLFSTHITADLERTADFITFIGNGSLLYTGTKDALSEKYVLVKGGNGVLTPQQRAAIVGYRAHSVGFDGLAERQFARTLPGVVAETADLDEIIVRFAGGGNAL